ncbi:IMP dehydrogenase [Kiritimatiella glycovorans]|uniref:Inosine-5'-monophosphate dehydrogenase n=1 Tax=Kiritimatiella glycovorans TaxID=1307763 RepID=A0A0G3EF94_9BACT|nr:IMP dehydrogenase [Kiritimatiella glycovorans]AKJ65008.1 Inosine-5'-monophosphate dehydrogenase [Kiritimatiella glycovorans]
MSRNTYLDSFMKSFEYMGLTFDDVTLVTQYADFLPAETGLGADFTRHIRMNIPFVSAAMDTVTEAPMATAMAMQGGIGVIHKNLDPAEQAAQVSRVKHYLNGLINQPITFRDSNTLREVRERRERKGYKFSGFPILDAEDRLAGILTSRDMKFASDPNANVSELMTREVITAPRGTSLQDAYAIMRGNKVGKLPIVEDDGHLVGLYSYADVQSLVENERPFYNRDSHYRLRAAAAVGPGDELRVEQLAEEDVDALVVDTAHGHSEGVVAMTRWIKKHYPHIEVVAGNIATGQAARDLCDAGADAVKVGIGPGSICTTRVVAGVGVPQISAIYEVARELDGEIPVIADGGIRHSGDIAKALVAGANTVMMGSLLAGTEESPGEKILYQGRQYVIYRGMGSLDAMRSRAGSRERYGLGDAEEDELVPQGIEGMVPYAGTVQKVMIQFCGGLRSSLGYCGCRNPAELGERGRFLRITPAGVTEAHPHDVKITKEAPNYRS